MTTDSNFALRDALVRVCVVVIATIGLQGCASGIMAQARSESSDSDFSDGIGLGQHRQEITARIGDPDRSITTDTGTLDLYVKKIDKGANDRAEEYGFILGATFFLAEPFLLANELLADHRVTMHYGFQYGKDNTLESITNGVSAQEIEKKFVREMDLRTQAAQGDKEAAFFLTKRYQDSSYLELLAVKGDLEAATELARLGGNSEPLRKLAEAGNANAEYALYKQLSQDDRTTIKGWRLLCGAANARDPQAQAQVGLWHQQSTWTNLSDQTRSQLIEAGVRPYNLVALMWFTIAASNGATATQLPVKSWGTSVLTPEEIAHAEQMARNWKSGDCPSAEHRLAPPGDS